MNGYFQLIIENNQVKLKLFPAREGGNNIDPAELVEYLDLRGVLYDKTMLYKAISGLNSIITITLAPEQQMGQENEMLKVKISEDKMEAIVRFYPQSNQGKALTKHDIIEDLKFNRILFGIDEVAIEDYIKDRKYCTDIVLARGKAATSGQDASIQYNFNTDLKARPTLKEDGSVDFFRLNNINHCKTGDILAVLTKECIGEKGYNVLGEILHPREVKRLSLKYGRNIEINEDKTILTSKVDGSVILLENKVFVNDVYKVENVDNSTGNIEFEGNVVVEGNVTSGFEIKCRGNVEIAGVVEGAKIEAGGNIVIARGMHGMGKGQLKAGGNIIAKFLENTTVIAEGYIETESILHSNVYAKTEVNVVSNKGFITGGKVGATNIVRVKNLGSPMGAETIVEVGIDPLARKRYTQLQESIVATQKNLSNMLPVLQATKQKISQGVALSKEQIVYFKQLVEMAKQKQEQLEVETKEMDEIQSILDFETKASVQVTGEVFLGVRISISGAMLILNDSVKYCKFLKVNGDIKMMSL